MATCTRSWGSGRGCASTVSRQRTGVAALKKSTSNLSISLPLVRHVYRGTPEPGEADRLLSLKPNGDWIMPEKKQYLLSIYQPEGGIPAPEVLQKIMCDVEEVNRQMKAEGAWVF